MRICWWTYFRSWCISLPPPHVTEIWSNSAGPFMDTHPSAKWGTHIPAPWDLFYRMHIQWISSDFSCLLSRFPHCVAKLGIWPSVFFKPCDPDVWIKKRRDVIGLSRDKRHSLYWHPAPYSSRKQLSTVMAKIVSKKKGKQEGDCYPVPWAAQQKPAAKQHREMIFFL